jgi:hypothetical protein
LDFSFSFQKEEKRRRRMRKKKKKNRRRGRVMGIRRRYWSVIFPLLLRDCGNGEEGWKERVLVMEEEDEIPPKMNFVSSTEVDRLMESAMMKVRGSADLSK